MPTKPTKLTRAQREARIAYSPICTVVHDHVRSPDVEGEFADNKYKITATFLPTDDVASLQVACDAASQQEFGRTGLRCWRVGDETGKADYKGLLVLTAKTKFAPPVYDADGNQFDGDIGRGALVQLEIEMVPHTAGGSQQVAPRLLAVQVLEQGEAVGRHRSGFAGRASPFARPPREDHDEPDPNPGVHMSGREHLGVAPRDDGPQPGKPSVSPQEIMSRIRQRTQGRATSGT